MAKKKTIEKEKSFAELAKPFLVRCEIAGLPGVPAMFNRRSDGTGKPNEDDAQERLRILTEMMYVNKKGVYVPSDNIRQMLIGNQCRTGAAMILGSYIESKKGKQYTEFCESCVWIHGPEETDAVYFHPVRKTWDGTDKRDFVKKTPSGAIRKEIERPWISTPWSLEFYVFVTSRQYTSLKVKMFFQVAGLRCGIGVYGPKFGRFIVKVWKEVPGKEVEKIIGKFM